MHNSALGKTLLLPFLRIGLEQNPKGTIVELEKYLNQKVTTIRRQAVVRHVASWGAPSCDALRYKCSVMHSDRELAFT